MSEQKPNIDCFAYNESVNKKHQCCALTERICNYGKCRFYKPEATMSESVMKLIREQKEDFNNEKKRKKNDYDS